MASRENENLAFWLSPLAAALPLIPYFALPSSPLFLGELMGEPGHPFLWPELGPWLAAMAVVFDATLLAYFVAVPLCFLLKAHGRASTMQVLLAFAVAGILASQLVHVSQGFRQPALREFAVSWLSPLFGCACGLASGSFFLMLANRRFPAAARAIAAALPVAILLACGSTLVWSANVWRAGR